MNQDQRNIPTKNYIILISVLIITVFITLFSCYFYREKTEYNIKNNNAMEFLSEIKKEEWDNYILENHDTIIYISSSMNSRNRKFELKIKNYINNKNLIKDFVYLDASTLDKEFYKKLNKNYLNNQIKHLDMLVQPNILILRDKKISHILYLKRPKKFDIKDVEKFLGENWIEEQ